MSSRTSGLVSGLARLMLGASVAVGGISSKVSCTGFPVNVPGDTPYNIVEGNIPLQLDECDFRTEPVRRINYRVVPGMTILYGTKADIVPNISAENYLAPFDVKLVPREVEETDLGDLFIRTFNLDFTDNDNYAPKGSIHTVTVNTFNNLGIANPLVYQITWNSCDGYIIDTLDNVTGNNNSNGNDNNNGNDNTNTNNNNNMNSNDNNNGNNNNNMNGNFPEPCTTTPLLETLTSTYTRFTDRNGNEITSARPGDEFTIRTYVHPELAGCYTTGVPFTRIFEMGNNLCVEAEFNPDVIIDFEDGNESGIPVHTLSMTDKGDVETPNGVRRVYETAGRIEQLEDCELGSGLVEMFSGRTSIATSDGNVYSFDAALRVEN